MYQRCHAAKPNGLRQYRCLDNELELPMLCLAEGMAHEVRRLRSERCERAANRCAVRRAARTGEIIRGLRIPLLSDERASRHAAQHGAIAQRVSGGAVAANLDDPVWSPGLP